MGAATLAATRWPRGREALVVRLRRAAGILLTANFAVFWLLPIAIQGQAFKLGLHKILSPIYARVDRIPALRRFAEPVSCTSPAKRTVEALLGFPWGAYRSGFCDTLAEARAFRVLSFAGSKTAWRPA